MLGEDDRCVNGEGAGGQGGYGGGCNGGWTQFGGTIRGGGCIGVAIASGTGMSVRGSSAGNRISAVMNGVRGI